MSQKLRKRISLNRKLNRLKGYDYTKAGWYFVTICLKNRFDVFGRIVDEEMVLNDIGKIVRDQWLWLVDQYDYVRLDEYVVMPDHFHGIIIINPYVVDGGGGRDMSRLVPTEGIISQDIISQDIISRDILTGDEDRSRPVPTPTETPTKIKSLSELIGAFKSVSSKLIHQSGAPDFAWQRSFHDHIIHADDELSKIRQYIHNNPINRYKN